MNNTEHYDAILIGAGQCNVPLSRALAEAGRKTALVERVHVGGTCLNEGCTPTKTMIASARAAYMARRSAVYGLHAGPVTVDMERVRQRKRNMVESFVSSSERRIAATTGLDLLRGEAQFVGPKQVEVALTGGGSRRLEAGMVVIDTGTRPAVPALPGLDEVPFLNSTSIMELDRVPDHLLVLGGGYVGLEFSQMFRRLGSRVSLVQRGEQLLAREDPDVAAEISRLMCEDGVDVFVEAAAVSAGLAAGGEIELGIRTAHEERTLVGSHLLVAAGRVPNTERLNLTATGVQVDARGYIPVDERLQTGVPGIYAVGDVNGGPAFTHISYDDYRILRANLLQSGSATTRGRLVPYVVYIDPELGRVGLTESEAKAQGLDYRVVTMPMSWVARADETEESRGFLKAVVDAASGQILGAACLAVEGGELMSMIEVAMLGHLPYAVLRDAIFAHPTLAEGLNNLFTSATLP